jgi:hypothetical protein
MNGYSVAVGALVSVEALWLWVLRLGDHCSSIPYCQLLQPIAAICLILFIILDIMVNAKTPNLNSLYRMSNKRGSFHFTLCPAGHSSS